MDLLHLCKYHNPSFNEYNVSTARRIASSFVMNHISGFIIVFPVKKQNFRRLLIELDNEVECPRCHEYKEWLDKDL